MKEEALKLADELDDCAKYGECDWVYPKIPADMIRKLVKEIDCLTLTAQHHEFMARHLGIIAKERQELLDKQSPVKFNQTLECPSYISGLAPRVSFATCKPFFKEPTATVNSVLYRLS